MACFAHSTKMTSELQVWVLAWLIFATSAGLYDCIFVLGRPHTFDWKIYKYFYSNLYVHVDKQYNDMEDGFVKACAVWNLLGCIINIITICLYFSSFIKLSNMFVFGSSLTTISGALLYQLPEYLGGMKSTGHNGWFRYLFIYWIPLQLWVIFPACIIGIIGNDIYQSIN